MRRDALENAYPTRDLPSSCAWACDVILKQKLIGTPCSLGLPDVQVWGGKKIFTSFFNLHNGGPEFAILMIIKSVADILQRKRAATMDEHLHSRPHLLLDFTLCVSASYLKKTFLGFTLLLLPKLHLFFRRSLDSQILPVILCGCFFLSPPSECS